MKNNSGSPVDPQKDSSGENNGIRGYFNEGKETELNLSTSSSTQNYAPKSKMFTSPERSRTIEALKELPISTHLNSASSDDDDIPLLKRRAPREPSQPRANTIAMTRNHHTSTRELVEQPTNSTGKVRKKPGPKPWAAKPIAKNDLAAKMEVVHDIEKLWGKDFIKTYIPKCHRPLVKKRKGAKRSIYRDHEIDPKKWLPSVLKAVLMIAQHTTDKLWLKKAMGEVVRYRIKHTGNRKPQLVTTDFDVIEDMLVRGWTCENSFNIRYKHLLMAQPKGQEDTDEDIEHILGAVDISTSDEDSDQDGNAGDNGENDQDMVDVDGDSGDVGTGKGPSGEYHAQNGYIQSAPHYPPKILLPKQPRGSLQSLQPPKPSKKPEPLIQSPPVFHGHGYGPMHGYGYPLGYGPSLDAYGRPIPGYPRPMNGLPPPMFEYEMYGGYGGYGSQAALSGKEGRNSGSSSHPRDASRAHYPTTMPSWPPHNAVTSPSGMVGPSGNATKINANGHGNRKTIGSSNQDARFSAFSYRSRSQENSWEDPTTPPSPSTNTNTRVKREPGAEEHPIAVDNYADGPLNHYGEEDNETSDLDEAVRMELEEAKAELKLQRIRTQIARAKQAKMKNYDIRKPDYFVAYLDSYGTLHSKFKFALYIDDML